MTDPVSKRDLQAEPPVKDIDVEQRLDKLLDSGRTRLLAGMIVHQSTRLLHLRPPLKDSVLVSIALASVVTLVFAHLPGAVLSAIFDSQELLNAFLQEESIVASVMVAYGIVTLKISYDRLIARKGDILSSLHGNQSALDAVELRLESIFSLRTQMIWALLVGGLATVSLFTAQQLGDLRYWVGDYYLTFILAFTAGHYIYVARLVPALARIGYDNDIELEWANPADSPWIRAVSSLLAELSMFIGFGIGIAMVGLFFVGRWADYWVGFVSILWFGVGIIGLSALVFFTIYYLNKAVRREKERSLRSFAQRLAVFKDGLGELKVAELSEASHLINLHRRVADSRDTSVKLRGLQSILVSFGIPTISFVAKVLDFPELISRLV